jgi:hypothetical protein
MIPGNGPPDSGEAVKDGILPCLVVTMISFSFKAMRLPLLATSA